jgi:hypothetical protein
MRLLVSVAVVVSLGWTEGEARAQLIDEVEDELLVRRVQIIGGVEYLGSRDDAGSPMRYTGYGYPIGLAYEQSRERSLAKLGGAFSHAGFNSGLLTAGIAQEQFHQAEPTLVRLSYGYWRKVGSGLRLQSLAGGELNSIVFFRSYQYDPHQIGTVELYDAITSLDLSARLFFDLSPRQRLMGRVALPLGGYVVRPSYAVRGDERLQVVREQWRIVTDGYWASWGELQRAQIELGYRLTLNDRLELDASYHVEAYRVRQPFVSRGLLARYSLGVSMTFGP